MSKMSSEVIDLVPKDGVFTSDLASVNKQDLTISKRNVNKKSKLQYLTKEQMKALLAGVSDPRDRLFLNLLWKTGLRISEAIHIEKRHINMEYGRITIRWLKNRQYNEREVVAPKGLIEQLVMYARTLKYDEKLFGFSRQRAEQITKKYLGVSPHKLRHSFAVNWLEQEMPIEILQRQLGHKSIQTTMKYVHVSDKRTRKYMDQVIFE
jgi:integrase/recombinase XerD